MPPESQTPQSPQTPPQEPTPQTPPPAQPPTSPPPQSPPPTVGGPYKKRSIWAMLLLYVVLAAVIYGAIYWFYLR